MIRTVLFDLDDTLLDFAAAERIALSRTLGAFGTEPTGRLLDRYHEINRACWERLERKELTRREVLLLRFKLFFDEAGITVDPAAAKATYEQFLSEGHTFCPGAPKILETLRSLGYSLALVSNGTAAVQHGRIASAGIAPFFRELFISEEVGHNKPDPAFFDACFARLPDARRGETVIVGDSLSSDILGGKNAGIATCLYRPAGSHAPFPVPGQSPVCPDAVITHLDELPDLLRNWV